MIANKSSIVKPQNQMSVGELINLAEQAYDEFSPAVGAKYLEDAVKQLKQTQQPIDPLLLHKLGIMYVDCGEPEKAHKAFQESINVSTNDNCIASNYLYIGQQCYGNNAKQAFEEGIKLMNQQIIKLKVNQNNDNDIKSNNNSGNNNSEIEKLKYEISSAYVSIAELFMSDLCGEPNAQTECEKHLNLSFKYYPNNIETFATFAEFKFCQKNLNKSIYYFKKCISTIFDVNINTINDVDNINSNKMNDKLDIFNDNYLSIDSFLKIIKLGIELNEYKLSLLIAKNVINSNDQIGEIWALGSYCYYKLNQNNDAAIWLSNAQSILDIDSTSGLNIELNVTLQTIKSQMNVNDLPDISKLNLNDDNDDVDDDIDAFLADDDDDDDIDLVQDNPISKKIVINAMNNGSNQVNSGQDIDIDDDDDDMIDID